jgi:hypothetical protein
VEILIDYRLLIMCVYARARLDHLKLIEYFITLLQLGRHGKNNNFLIPDDWKNK